MQRIIFLNRFFFPDHSATSQLLGDLAFDLAKAGHDVHVVTSRQLYDVPDAQLAAEETVRGVHVTRVRSTAFGRGNLAGRAADYATGYAGMARAALRITRPRDILIAKTDPPLLSVLGQYVAHRRGATLINWLQDLYPEVAATTGVPLMSGRLAQGLTALRDRSLHAAAVNVVLGTAMAERLRQRGVPSARIDIIPNWTDDHAIAPLPRGDNDLRRQWRLGDRFVVGYSGNLGRTHDVETLLDAARRLRQRNDIVFVFIGGGTRFDEIRRRVEQDGLNATVRFFPYQPRASLPLSLTLPDLHWLSLRPALEGLIFPSKFYGIAAAGRPMLALAAPDGELAALIARNRCGFAVAPGDGDSVARIILDLADGGEVSLAALGRNARALLDANFTRPMALARWRQLLERV